MILAIQPQCPYCEEGLVLSVEMLEALVKMEAQYDDPFDQAIAEALKHKNGKDHLIPMADIPFFIWCDTDQNAIFLGGWCAKCRRISAPVFPLSVIQKTMDDSKEGRMKEGDAL